MRWKSCFAWFGALKAPPPPLLPAARPPGKDEKLVTVRLYVCPPPGVFKPSRLYPNKNNVRTAWYLQQQPGQEGPSEPPTPHYNNAVLCDLALEHHLHHLSSAAADFPGMKDGIAILKVWLHQRQLDKVTIYVRAEAGAGGEGEGVTWFESLCRLFVHLTTLLPLPVLPAR
ncbi:hypothetical protein FKM82_030139 [Ascaphus truei]